MSASLSRNSILLVAAVCAGVAAAILFLAPGDPAKEPARAARYASVVLGGADGFTVRAVLDQNRLYQGDRARYRLIFENRSRTQAAAVRFFNFWPSGFDFPRTWAVRGVPLGVPLNTLIVAPGTTEWIETCLKAASGADGNFFITAVLGVTRSAASAAELPIAGQVPLSTGPVEVTTAWRESYVLFLNRGYKVAKDLTLPVLLAILAYLFQESQKKREERENAAREARERRQQVWNSQLPRLHENAERYYMPITRGMRMLVRKMNELCSHPTQGTAEQREECIYYFLLVLRRWKHLRDDRGSIFFKDRDGEKVVQLAWFVLNWHIEQVFESALRDRALSQIGVTEDFEGFRKTLENSIALQTCGAILMDWSRSAEFPQCLHLFDLLRQILSFETNRPFDDLWYSSPTEFEVKADYTFPAEPVDDISRLRAALKAYYDQTQTYLGVVNGRTG